LVVSIKESVMFDRTSYNSIQDSTGSNGSLPDQQYNIHCKAIGGPDWRLNYLAESCETRLKAKVKRLACSFGDGCPRFRPTVATISKPVRKRKRGPKENHKCFCCGKVGTHQSRGLITTCYDRHKWAKTLDKYPRANLNHVFTEEAT
jgi:hypothetical protein